VRQLLAGSRKNSWRPVTNLPQLRRENRSPDSEPSARIIADLERLRLSAEQRPGSFINNPRSPHRRSEKNCFSNISFAADPQRCPAARSATRSPLFLPADQPTEQQCATIRRIPQTRQSGARAIAILGLNSRPISPYAFRQSISQMRTNAFELWLFIRRRGHDPRALPYRPLDTLSFRGLAPARRVA